MLQKTAPPMNNVVQANNMNGMDNYEIEVLHCETPLKTQFWATPAPHLPHERYLTLYRPGIGRGKYSSE